MQLATKYFKDDHPENATKATLQTNLGVANGDLKFEAVIPGVEGNDIVVKCVDPGDELSVLSASLSGNVVTISPETNDTPVSATAVIGEGDDGEVTITVVAAGSDGNDIVVEVSVADGNDEALAVAFADGVLSVKLGTDGNGDADDAKNTATLVRAAIHGLDEFTAAHSGTGADPIEPQNVQFSGGLDYTPISTATEIVAELGDVAGLDALADVEVVGNGSGITNYFEENLSDGRYATSAPEALVFVVADGFYVCQKPVTKREVDGWTKYIEE